MKTVRTLLAAGSEVDHARSNGDTALLVAAEGGHAEVTEALAEAGADVNHAANAGATALHVAALTAVWRWFECCWRPALTSTASPTMASPPCQSREPITMRRRCRP